MIIDTHCHLSKQDYNNIDEVIKNFSGNIMIISGTNTQDCKEVAQIVNKYMNVYGTIGFHPECASDVKNEDYILLEEMLQNPKIVGIGEIGLDYHYPGFDKNVQKEVFVKQIELAKKHKKSIVVHTRDAIKDTLDIIKETNANIVPVTLHCFSESLEIAKEAVKMGCKLGVGGVVTFKNGRKLKEVVENIDLSNILLETDSPYLSPEPYRGQKNEPKNVVLVAQEIAKIKNINIEEVINITTKNAKEQYKI